MPIAQQTVSIHSFAREMRSEDDDFATRVARFEARFGAVDDDTLALLAQACYTCWFACDHAADLASACRAIGSGRPGAFSLCFQVTPAQWLRANTLVVGVQRWLGGDARLPDGVDPWRVACIGEWLGEQNAATVALARLLLAHLMDELLWRVSLTRLGDEAAAPAEVYADLRGWYSQPAADLEQLAAEVRRAMAGSPDDAEELIAGILCEEQPCCMHRFIRHQEIKLASVGALKRRGSLLPDDGGKQRWQTFTAEVVAALRAWMGGAPPESAMTRQIHELLGERDDARRVIVEEFLLVPPANSRFSNWLGAHAPRAGSAMGIPRLGRSAARQPGMEE